MILLLILRDQFCQSYFSGLRGPNRTEFGGDIGPSEAFNEFILDFRHRFLSAGQRILVLF